MRFANLTFCAVAAVLSISLFGCGPSVQGHNFCPQIWVPDEPTVADYSLVSITHEGKKGIFLSLEDAEVVVRAVKDWQYAFRQLKKTIETYNRWAEREVREAPD
jgi:hypothetical protein